MKTFIVLSVFSMLIACSSSFLGFRAGAYWTTEKAHKQAIAHECGRLDPETLAFRWNVQPSVQLAASMLPAQVRR